MKNTVKTIYLIIMCIITIIALWKLLYLFAILIGNDSLIELIHELIKEIYNMLHGWCPKSLDDCEKTHKLSLLFPAIIADILLIIALLAPLIFTISVYFSLIIKDYSLKQAIITPFIGFIGGILLFLAILMWALGSQLLFECLHDPIWAFIGIILFLVLTSGGVGGTGAIIFLIPTALLDD